MLNPTKRSDFCVSPKCVDYYEESDEWAILYTDEVANIQLGLRPEKVPTEAQPLIIARLHMSDEHSMIIDVRSIERASNSTL